MSIQISGQDVIDDSKNIVNVVAYTGPGVATKPEAEEGTNNDQLMTPLRVKQAIEAIMGTTTPERTGNYFTYSIDRTVSFNISRAGNCLIDRNGHIWLSYSSGSSTRLSVAGRPGSFVSLGASGANNLPVTTLARNLCGIAQNPDTGAFIWAGQTQIFRAVDPTPAVTNFDIVASNITSTPSSNLNLAHYGGNNTFVVASEQELGRLYVSTDDGLNWNTIINPGGNNRSSRAISGWNNRWIHANSDGISYSSDNANTFTEVGNNTTLRNLSGFNQDTIQGALVSKKTGTLFLGGRRGVMRSTDNGNNWSYVSLVGVNQNADFTHIVEAPNGAIFAGAQNTTLSGQQRGSLFRSIDDGVTWTQQLGLSPGSLFEGMSGLAIGSNNEIVLNITGANGVAYAYSDFTTTAGEAIISFNNLLEITTTNP